MSRTTTGGATSATMKAHASAPARGAITIIHAVGRTTITLTQGLISTTLIPTVAHPVLTVGATPGVFLHPAIQDRQEEVAVQEAGTKKHNSV